MTTTLKVTTNGPYVATVTDTKTGRVLALVGPGSNVEQYISFSHGQENHFSVVERPATEEERRAYDDIELARTQLFKFHQSELNKLNGQNNGSL